MVNEVRVEMPPKQKEEYRFMERHLWLELEGKEAIAANRGVLYQKLLQLANGAMYTERSDGWAWFHDAKLDVLQELVEDSLRLARPVMIVHNFKSDYARIAQRMGQMGVNYRLLDSSQDEDDWNSGKIDALGLHPARGGHGLNLQDGGETVIWFGLNPSQELHNQANGRLAGGRRRLGKNIRIHYLVAEGTVDEDVMSLLEDKQLTEDRLFQAMKRRLEGMQ
jgi:SNF2 family DNA or RNA helicase